MKKKRSRPELTVGIKGADFGLEGWQLGDWPDLLVESAKVNKLGFAIEIDFSEGIEDAVRQIGKGVLEAFFDEGLYLKGDVDGLHIMQEDNEKPVAIVPWDKILLASPKAYKAARDALDYELAEIEGRNE